MTMEPFHLHHHHHHHHQPFNFWSYNNNGGQIFMEQNMVKRETWVKHYSSYQTILLVGEGDFSFSLSLAIGFGSAKNIYATSLNSFDTLINTYKKARVNLDKLQFLGATLLHGVDARKMKNHPILNTIKFDCIVYNFPHAGFYGKEDNPDMIKMHQALVSDFFSNAKWLLKQNGQVHVTHKTKPPYSCWNLEELARQNSLRLEDCVIFDIKDYPLYENKRGHGSTSDESFDCKDSYTFKFTVAPFQTNMFFTDHSSSLSNFLGYCSTFREAMPRVKFIVKAELHLNSRAAGCAGALVDENNSIRAKFCGPLRLEYWGDADVAELLAIKYALLMFERSDLCSRNVALDVVTDSNLAVSWIQSHLGNPGVLMADLQEIMMALNRIPNRVGFCCSHGEYRSEHYKLVRQLAVQAFHTHKMYEAWLPDNLGY